MLKFAYGRITGTSLDGDITSLWTHCPDCLKCLTHKDIKVNIGGVAYCVRCASEYYEALSGSVPVCD